MDKLSMLIAGLTILRDAGAKFFDVAHDTLLVQSWDLNLTEYQIDTLSHLVGL